MMRLSYMQMIQRVMDSRIILEAPPSSVIRLLVLTIQYWRPKGRNVCAGGSWRVVRADGARTTASPV
jgi:hypothetical protein